MSAASLRLLTCLCVVRAGRNDGAIRNGIPSLVCESALGKRESTPGLLTKSILAYASSKHPISGMDYIP